jgi:hypothetical protein
LESCGAFRRQSFAGQSRSLRPFYNPAFAHTMTRGLAAATLGQVAVLSLITVTGILRGPQYPITSTSFWLHSPLHAAPVQSRRMTRMAFSAAPGGPAGPSAPRGPGGPDGPAGPGGPAGSGSPFSPDGPAAPGSPFGPSHPDAQMDNAIATAIPLMFIIHLAFSDASFSHATSGTTSP